MDWREAAFVTVFTVACLAILKLVLVSASEANGWTVIAPIVAVFVVGALAVERWANRGSEKILRQLQEGSHLAGEPERLGSSPSVLALPPPDQKRQTSQDRREQAGCLE